MGSLLTDRAKVLPLLAVMIVIAVGATLIILLTSPSGGDTGSTGNPAAASGSARGGPGKTVKVAISNFKYGPATVTIKQGTKVAWTDNDTANHTATGKGFDTGSIDKGQTKTAAFKRRGTYKYICQFHPFMHGTVVVR